jgi:cytochrome c peroxidase
MFFDPAWSATGRMSWVSRRDPAHASGPPRRLAPGQLPPRFGGADPRQPGPLVVPSPMHTPATPQCTEHFFGHDDAADDSADNGPAGDLTWIGRVDRGRDITGAALPWVATVSGCRRCLHARWGMPRHRT